MVAPWLPPDTLLKETVPDPVAPTSAIESLKLVPGARVTILLGAVGSALTVTARAPELLAFALSLPRYVAVH